MAVRLELWTWLTSRLLCACTPSGPSALRSDRRAGVRRGSDRAVVGCGAGVPAHSSQASSWRGVRSAAPHRYSFMMKVRVCQLVHAAWQVLLTGATDCLRSLQMLLICPQALQMTSAGRYADRCNRLFAFPANAFDLSPSTANDSDLIDGLTILLLALKQPGKNLSLDN